MTTTYLDLIHRGAGYNPERTAIVFGDQSLTFGETQTLSNQLAHALIERGVQRGDRVALERIEVIAKWCTAYLLGCLARFSPGFLILAGQAVVDTQGKPAAR